MDQSGQPGGWRSKYFSTGVNIFAQVEDAFDNNDHATVAEKLVGMQQSLRLLHHVADYQDRVAHLEQHKNRLEATLSPLLVTAFTTRNTEAALALVQMFRSVERDKQLSKYYQKCVRAGMVQAWALQVSEGDGELEVVAPSPPETESTRPVEA